MKNLYALNVKMDITILVVIVVLIIIILMEKIVYK